MIKRITGLVMAVGLIGISAFAQDVPGCTDPRANNYNPDATENDGSCTYNPTIYTPGLLYLLPDDVVETSGLIYDEGFLWTINDSGNDPVLFKLDTANGKILQEVTLSDASNVDWEALAQDDAHIYVGDFGNNAGNRDDLTIYIVKKADLPQSGDGEVTSEKITYTYPDFQKKKRDHNFDCEAMITIQDSLYLFSKNWGDYRTKLYRLPKIPGNYVAELIDSYDVSGLVTGADYNEASKETTLVGYTNNNFVPFMWLLFDYNENELFSGNKRRIDLLGITATQVEAIAYRTGKNGTMTAEGSFLITQSAYEFNTAVWTDDTLTGIGYHQGSGFDFTLSPNPVKENKLTITIAKLPRGEYNVELFDSSGKLMQISDYQVLTQRSSVKIDLSVANLDAGIYFVRLRSMNAIIEKKFIKQ